MTGQNPTPTTSWYYRVEEREVGPVTSNRLRQLARQGKLADDDLVRKGRTGDWEPAGSIDWLQARARTVARESDEDVWDVLESAPQSALSALIDSLREGVQSTLHWMRKVVGGSLQAVRQVIAAALLIAVAASFVQIARDAGLLRWSKPVNALAAVRELGDDVKRLRETKASDAEWEALAARGDELLPQVVADLEPTAGADDRMAQMLLWSARDCLPKMFADARQQPNAAEQRYDEYMQNVALLQKGLPIYARNAGAASAGPRGPEESPLSRAVVVAVLLADGAIVIWFVYWWWGRSGANASMAGSTSERKA